MNDMPEDRRLFREAADLAIRLQNDPANPVSAEMVRAWAARSPDHAAAWARVAEIHGMTGKILGGEGEDGRKAGLSRRRLIVGGATGLAAIAVGSWAVPRALLLARADHITATAEISRIELPDGSVMTLGPDSAVALGYNETRRDIGLLAGMAYFEVAQDPLRPFSVAAGTLTATALGTAFDVSSDAGFVSVSVERGIVESRAPDSEIAAGGRLAAGEWLTLDLASRRLTRGMRETPQTATWRSGMIVADRESVAAVVAKIARWQRGSVVIADPGLGARIVSGVFDLRDPVRALDAVVRPFGARVREIGGLMTIISPV